MGGEGRNSSGDIFLAFSTANAGAAARAGVMPLTMLPNEEMNPLFEATIQATEEAIVNALVAAETMTGINGNTVHALPHDRLVEIMKRYRPASASPSRRSSAMPSTIAFDIEIANPFPDGVDDWQPFRPFGISCAATLTSRRADDACGTAGRPAATEPGDRMSRDEVAELIAHLEIAVPPAATPSSPGTAWASTSTSWPRRAGSPPAAATWRWTTWT